MPSHHRKMPDTHGWIWPKDPRPGNAAHWPRRWRWLDLFTNRGPDIFVGRLRANSTPRDRDRDRDSNDKNLVPASWSRWNLDRINQDDGNDERNIHPAFRGKPQPQPQLQLQQEQEPTSPFPWARRKSAERYDFRTKRYCIPDSGTWSGVQYCRVEGSQHQHQPKQKHVIPVRYWDRDGKEYPAGYWHDVVYGSGRCDRGMCRRGGVSLDARPRPRCKQGT